MVITLTGANAFALKKAEKELTSSFLNEHGDMALERLDGDEATFERIQEALTSVPFLASKKMVLLKQAAGNKQFVEKAADLLGDIPETTDVLVVEPKLDKRSSYYKFLKKSTDYREFAELDQLGLSRWLTEYAKTEGGNLTQADANLLISRVGANQQLLGNELEKLLLYDKKITSDAIRGLTESTPQSTVFELLEAAFAGNATRALALYDEQRALKVEPQQIIAMLSWQLHILAVIKAGGERSPDAIAAAAKLSPYVVKKSSSIARKLSATRLKQLVADLLVIDSRSKRETFNTDDALKYFILQIIN
jgi:DNA polymerase III subunit delta